jgi:hypothetical protein
LKTRGRWAASCALATLGANTRESAAQSMLENNVRILIPQRPINVLRHKGPAGEVKPQPAHSQPGRAAVAAVVIMVDQPGVAPSVNLPRPPCSTRRFPPPPESVWPGAPDSNLQCKFPVSRGIQSDPGLGRKSMNQIVLA